MDHLQPSGTCDTEGTSSISIQDIPEEIILHIAQFLSPEDINACLNVCLKWKVILNSNSVWKKYCIYSEKHFKGDTEVRMQKLALNESYKVWCLWRKYFNLQTKLWENWRDGLFSIEKCDIGSTVRYVKDFVDDYGNYWLFIELSRCSFSIYNITGSPRLHSEVEFDLKVFPFELRLFNDKILSCDFNYAEVYQFKPPEFELKLEYQFRFNDNVVSDRKLTTDDSDRSVNYCCTLVDQLFLICIEETVNIEDAFLHVWDLESAQKVAKKSVFQDSDCHNSSSFNCTSGSLKLFDGHSKQVLLGFFPAIVTEFYDLCLYSLENMKIVKVIARVIGSIDCKMKGKLILLFMCNSQATCCAFLYNVNGDMLHNYYLPGDYTYVMENNCYLTEYKAILKVTKQKIHVTSVIGPKELRHNDFDIEFGLYISFFQDPNLLFMSCPFTMNPEVSVWDTDKGLKLWEFSSEGMFDFVNCYKLYNSAYPYKMFVRPRGEDTQMKFLNFEENVNELSQQGRRVGSRIFLDD